MANGGIPLESGIGCQKGADPEPAEEEVGDGGEVPEGQVAVNGEESVTDGMLKALDLLDERARAISTRLEPIEVRMRELRREDEEERKALARAVPGEI
jgi:hypothetical protein